MTIIYDNWDRLVYATLDREELRRLAMDTSLISCTTTSTTASFSSADSFQSDSVPDYVPGSLTDRVVKAAENAAAFKHECSNLKSKAEKLAFLLRKVRRKGNDVYDRPMTRIVPHMELVLEKALKLLLKCSRHSVRRVFGIIKASAFQEMSSELESSIADVSWFLSIFASGDESFGLPPMASFDPILCVIWGQIGILHTGSSESRSDAAAFLASLAQDSDRSRKMIVEEDGVRPLLKLVEDGGLQGQENAAKAIGYLGKDPKTVKRMVDVGVCQVFAKMLKRGPMQVQATVAWAVSELAAHYPKCQHLFAQHNIIPLLLSHLALQTSHSDPSIEGHMKAMAAKALWHLAKGNSPICRSITNSRALLCFVILFEEGPDEARYNSAMALMEITAMAEKDAELRKSAFNQTSPACEAVVDQLLRIVEKADSEPLLIPCIKTIGNLAVIFKETETRMINPLVMLLDAGKPEFSREVCIALTKFDRAEVIGALEWACKLSFLGHVEDVERLLPVSKAKMVLYQHKGSR